jgi:peptidoglycan hydrolase-like protein with peptidoglycan-binding domain
MTTVTDFLNQVRGLIGVREQPDGSNYAPPITPWYADLVGNQGFARAAWCAMTQTYGLHHSGFGAFIYAYCPYIEHDAQAGVLGMQWSDTPQEGALAIYSFGGREADHVGVVEAVYDNGTFAAIEGNWGNRCQRMIRDTKYVRGFVILPLDGAPASPQTEAALKALQVKMGVEADGICGPQTYAALDRLFAYLAAQAATPPSTGLVEDGVMGPATTKALQSAIGATPDGNFGPASRRALQQHLGVTADGIIGPNTVKALQRHVGVTADGRWGPQTTRAIQHALNAGTF